MGSCTSRGVCPLSFGLGTDTLSPRCIVVKPEGKEKYRMSGDEENVHRDETRNVGYESWVSNSFFCRFGSKFPLGGPHRAVKYCESSLPAPKLVSVCSHRISFTASCLPFGTELFPILRAGSVLRAQFGAQVHTTVKDLAVLL